MIDLADQTLILQATAETRTAALALATNQVATARNAATQWTGPGITSSAAASNPAKGLAVVLNEDRGRTLFTEFGGVPVDTNSVIVAYTWNGDLNLDGRIDATDFFLMDRSALGGLDGYRSGDVNYDGIVNLDDYALVDAAFAAQSGAGTGLSAVPEPGMALWALAAVAVATRRRQPPR